ncbi:hypothetical protein EDC94DRAFT_588499 [Helicostylum pulchrum]|nr:hypothetical protein EDC94DRAFT_588499 [Helicostylum pulchrum]
MIKNFESSWDEEYDPVEHADELTLSKQSAFTSPVIPFWSMLRKEQTTIFFLNSLFLSVNDKIAFNWIEIETLVTEKTKWDGVGFCPTIEKNLLAFTVPHHTCRIFVFIKTNS